MASGRDFIGPFRLIRLIRAGQTTQVWEARKDGEKERCALKVLLESEKGNKSEIDALKHEAKVAAKLDHPNVIKIYGYFDRFGLPMIQMQLFHARNLKLELRDNHEAVHLNVAAIIRKCAKGLHHLHENGWVHCDIKPDNFLVDEQGNVKVIDFSIARPIKQGFRLFGGKAKIQGTRSYMAPEQIRGKKIDARSDVYGFGCVMFEMIARRPPFSGLNSDELLRKHLNAPPPTLQAADRRVRIEFSDLIGQMMSKDPAKRPQSMEEVLALFSKMRVFRAGMRPKGATS